MFKNKTGNLFRMIRGGAVTVFLTSTVPVPGT